MAWAPSVSIVRNIENHVPSHLGIKPSSDRISAFGDQCASCGERKPRTNSYRTLVFLLDPVMLAGIASRIKMHSSPSRSTSIPISMIAAALLMSAMISA